MNNHTCGHCPHCSSARLERQHRGFIRKHILRMHPIFACLYCDKQFSKRKIKYKQAFTQDVTKHPHAKSLSVDNHLIVENTH